MKYKLPCLTWLRLSAAVTLALFIGASDVSAQTLGNAWHVAQNPVPNTSDTMRTPLNNIDTGTTVTLYNGNQFQGTGNPGNQNGGFVIYKNSTGLWQSVALSFATESNNDKFWKASITAPSSASGRIQYYFKITYTDKSDTYIYYNISTGQSAVTSSENQAASFAFTFQMQPTLKINGVNANYTTSKLFVDENAGDSRLLDIYFTPNDENITAVEIYTNLNRRNYAQGDANGDGVEDGIQPPDGNLLVAGDDNNYYKAYAMSSIGSGQYSLTLNAQKTGAYRLTARWKVQGDPNNWRWYTNSGANRRDHAITVSPVDARNARIYEINALTIEAQDHAGVPAMDPARRSTLEDLFDAPNAPRTADGKGINLDYFTGLGVNWLWFQPVHPPAIDGRETDPATGSAYNPGSPYAVKNFFEISPWFTTNFSGGNEAAGRQAAMLAFQGFVSAADNKGVGVMLDAPFNHTAFDVELAQVGVSLFQPDGQTWNPTDEIRNRDARFFSRANEYNQRAFSAASIAPAPDREDFGKWNDTKDVFFGVYAALVHSGQNGNHTNEGDWFDYTNSNWTANDYTKNGQPQNITKNVWKYFAEYTLFWLDKTGVPAGSNMATQTAFGIDGLRADFGQGLPPQLWEYITNKTRTRKWNFVFMSESLDGGAVTYRSNRHFDILNENIVFPLKAASSTSNYRSIFDDRRNAYGQGLVLLNNTSHDEENYSDIFEPLIRYQVCSTVDGAPMVFMGQELGVNRDSGFRFYELNFGKLIAHFKKFNSMEPAFVKRSTNAFGEDFLFDSFSAVGKAREFSPALRSSNRYYLNQTGGGSIQEALWSVAKYTQAEASPNFQDVVFAFANITKNSNPQGNFNVNVNGSGGGNLFGIKSGRTYNVRNIAAFTKYDLTRRDQWLWGNGRTGDDILATGVFVSMNSIPPSNAGWSSAPFEAQYLKIYDVTPPPAAGAPGTPKAYAIGDSATFSWSAASDPDGGISGYRVVISTEPNGGGTVLFDGIVNGASKSITGSFDQTLYAQVTSINNAGIEGGTSSSAGGTILLDPAGDKDGDGMNNEAEDYAGTDPLNNASIFKVTSVERVGNDVVVTWNSVAGKAYVVQSRTSLTTGNWADIPGSNTTASGSTASYTHVGATGESYYYRVRLAP